jgi:tight adherence protein B
MQTIGKEGPAPVNEVFGALSDQLKIGISLGDALKMSSKQIGLPDFRFFTVAVVVEQSAGGNLASTLDVLSEIMRKRRAIRLKAQAVTAEIRFSAYVLGALPFFTTGALLLIQPDYLAPLFSDPRGHVILGIVVGGLTLSILTMRHMMRSISSV